MSRGVKTVICGAAVALLCAASPLASADATSVGSLLSLRSVQWATQTASARLEVVPSHGIVGLGYLQSASDPAPSHIAFHVANGFTLIADANGAAAGTLIGSDVILVGTRPAQPLTGVLTVEDRGAFAPEGSSCSGTSTHDAVWAASFPSPTGVRKIPIFVDGRTFTICPDAARLGGTPTAIAFQLGLVGNSGLNRSLITAPATPGRFVWTATVTRPGLPDVEIRSIVDLPQRASFRAKVVSGSIRISGRVTANRRGSSHVRIRAVVTNRRRRGFDLYGRTRADGRFTLIHRLGRGTFFVRANSYPEQRDVTASECAAPSSAADGCVSATEMILGLQATPGAIRVRSSGSR
jgi:hypothetical protein